ncbi:MAG TPA: YidB family protein [Pseudolabrys sp.]|nr:YidB family protein [Pseudolabrys sp.]
MGLLDVLTGMQNGPRGQQNPNATSGGMSPITMAVLGLLAYKAMKGFTGSPASQTAGGRSGISPDQDASTGGGLGGLLHGGLGGLGGLLAGGAAGSVLSGGLGDLMKQFQQGGQGDVAKSWIGTGPNRTIAPDQLASVLSPEQIDMLTAQTGMSRDELLEGLSQHLPEVVDRLTPEGRIPSEQDLAQYG